EGEWKPLLDPELGGRLKNYLSGRQSVSSSVRARMGGAAGNMAHVLSRLTLDTTGFWLYHSAEMAFDSPANLKRLRLEDRQKPESARVEGTYVSSSGARYPDPARRSFVIDFKKDFELCGVRAKDSGRVIFIVPQYISDVRPWSRLILRTFTSTGTP